MIVSWFSAGVSSAVATKIANPDLIIYIDIEDQHPDTYRFLNDCENWFEKKIIILKSPHGSVEKACLSASYLVGVAGAACTRILKKRVRQEWEAENGKNHTYVWGFDGQEKHRAERVVSAMPNNQHLFPILDRKKSEVHGILAEAGIKRPAMYDLGYPNNNCIGCLKGGMGYWNKIRKDFPVVFESRCALEKHIGAKIFKQFWLSELPEGKGKMECVVPDCGMFCELPEARPALNAATEHYGSGANFAQQA